MRSSVLAALAAIVFASSSPAALRAYPVAEAQTLSLAKETISLRSVQGKDNRTKDVAAVFKAALVAGGWADADVEIVSFEDTAYMVATWRGSDPALKPLVISGHMDVVEANPADWQRDPFTPVVENGYLFGRGASDMKFDGSLFIASLVELRRQHYQPRRTIVIAYSGDEETDFKTGQILAKRFANAELVLNIDGSNGSLDEKTGRPSFWSWQGAEKTYMDFQLEVTNPGGHSSLPRNDNAIVEISAALGRVAAYRFKPELNDITREYFAKASALQSDPKIAAAMRAFAANPADPAAIQTLRADPSFIGKIGTTCVPTLINGGHAVNALPQRVTAVVDCRVFPGHSSAEIMAELERVAAAPTVKFSDVTIGSVSTDPSPLRPDFVEAVERAIRKSYPGIPVFPSQASGASESMWYRAQGVPSYGASPSFIKDSDEFAHGLNERTPLTNIRPGITYYLSLIPDLTK